MDSGNIALIAVAVLTLLGTIYGIRTTYKTSRAKLALQAKGVDAKTKETSVTEFEANIRAFDLRAQNAETRADAAEAKADALTERVEALETKDGERDRQLNRIRLVVQKWFRDLSGSWSEVHPMPLPSDEDMELLGITLGKKRTT